MRQLGWLGVGAAATLLLGCGTPRALYYWGSYEPLIYTMYATPGKATPEDQVLKLEEDFQKAKAKNQPVPPGFHAHLGYLYFQLGKTDEARREFETEKANFPESSVFMDRLLAKLNKS
jgi:hypothetical protein